MLTYWLSAFYSSFLYHLILLASLSDSNKVKISPCLTGPFTFLIIDLLDSSTNSTLTWEHWPWEPVRPRTWVTLAYLGAVDLSIFWIGYSKINCLKVVNMHYDYLVIFCTWINNLIILTRKNYCLRHTASIHWKKSYRYDRMLAEIISPCHF